MKFQPSCLTTKALPPRARSYIHTYHIFLQAYSCPHAGPRLMVLMKNWGVQRQQLQSLQVYG